MRFLQWHLQIENYWIQNTFAPKGRRAKHGAAKSTVCPSLTRGYSASSFASSRSAFKSSRTALTLAVMSFQMPSKRASRSSMSNCLS